MLLARLYQVPGYTVHALVPADRFAEGRKRVTSVLEFFRLLREPALDALDGRYVI